MTAPTYKAYIRKQIIQLPRRAKLPACQTLGIVGNCNCPEPFGVDPDAERVGIYGVIYGPKKETVYQTDIHLQCCSKFQWALCYFWLAARKRLRQVHFSIRTEKSFCSAVKRLSKRLSTVVAYPDPDEYFVYFSRRHWHRRLSEAAEQNRQQRFANVESFIANAKERKHRQDLPACFRVMQFDSMPDIGNLKSRFISLAIQTHPDRTGADACRFREIEKAYKECLAFY